MLLTLGTIRYCPSHFSHFCYHLFILFFPFTTSSSSHVLIFCFTLSAIFHPLGEYLFIAAPDPPRLPHATFTPCRLYAIPFADILDPTKGNPRYYLSFLSLCSSLPCHFSLSSFSSFRAETFSLPLSLCSILPSYANCSIHLLFSSLPPPPPPSLLPSSQPLELWTTPAIVPQIHLYSDGGLDISHCGNYILTCAILYVSPRTITKRELLRRRQEATLAHRRSFSPISHRERSGMFINS